MPWTIQSREFSRSEYWSGQPSPSPGDLPNPGIEPRSPTLPVDSLPAEPQEKPKNTGVGSLSSLLHGIPGTLICSKRGFVPWKDKDESEKVGLKLNIQKTKIMASAPITSWEIDGETVETVSES